MCDTSKIIRSTAYARGTVWWVTLQIDPMCNTLQRFKRPCLIISNDEYNMKFGKVTIIPMSSKQKYDNWENIVVTSWGSNNSYILCDQIRQIDTEYLESYAFTLNEACMKQVEEFLNKFYFKHTDVIKETLSNNTLVENTAVCNNNKEVKIKDKVETVQKELDKISSTNRSLIKNMTDMLTKKAETVMNTSSDGKTVTTATTSNNTTNTTSNTINRSIEVDDRPQNLVNGIRHRKEVVGPAPCKNYKGRCTSQMPHGYYTILDHNIKWWNDYLNYGQKYVMDHYNLNTIIRFQKRKYIVKKTLLEHNYDITKPIITGKEN